MSTPGRPAEPVSLDLMSAELVRRRALTVSAGAVVLAAAIGGVIGLVGGRLAGLLAAAIVAIPLLLLAFTESRRRTWLADGVVCVRAFGTRRVDLRTVTSIELLITEVRGNRVVGLLVTGPPKGKTINLAVASYTATGGRELGVLALRRLADALAGGEDPGGLVFAELLVAQLRAEAREAGGADRPLFRIASLAPGGRLAQRLRPEAVTRFVATLD
ncbi:MAG TPA: hypothetical protein VG756_20655 [Pseudonocardiaceae bacterium]|jgi:hypothetical protein|nr:hypothetical protein [Pseudonocardiaceae bacterium]